MFTLTGLIIASAAFNGCAPVPAESPATAFCAFAPVIELAEAPEEATFRLGAGDELGAMVFDYMLVLGAIDLDATVYASAEFPSD